MTLLIGRKIAAGFLLALVALLVIGAVAYRNFQESNSDSRWVAHTIEVLFTLESIGSELKDSEASARGFYVSGDPDFAEDFKKVGDELNEVLSKLISLTRDNAFQQERIAQLRTLIAARRAISQELIDLRAQTSGLPSPATAKNVQNGKRSSGVVQHLIAEMIAEEEALLVQRREKAAQMVDFTSKVIISGTLIAFGVVGLAGFFITRSITRPLATLQTGVAMIGEGKFAHRVHVPTDDEVSHLAKGFNRMAEQMEERQRRTEEQDWLKTRIAEFARLLQGQRDLRLLASTVLGELAARLSLPALTFYFRRVGKTDVDLLSSYACEKPRPTFAPGEGLVGQCFIEGRRILIDAVPETYFVGSSLGQAKPKFLLLQPLLFEGQAKGVIEAASFERFSELYLTLFDRLGESLGIILTGIEATQRTEDLLQQTRSLAETLKENEAQLKEKNIELEAQTDQLRKSEVLLQQQQEELRQSNDELQQSNEELRQTTEEMEEKAILLAEQKKELEQTNREIGLAQEQLKQQAEQLELTSKYKSEFLANMSHELRTPLNSLLILSKMLADNPDHNLTAKQVQYAHTIQSSGNDLLELINDILDLSKIEAGKVDLDIQEVTLSSLVDFAEATFRPLAETKKLAFTVFLDPGLPKTITTDQRRLEQIIKNLLSNALKFTEKGSVELKIVAAAGGTSANPSGNFGGGSSIAFAVSDSGIGISPDKQKLIFEAFRQADAGTSRRYGGSGLGLSISRELARLLGGFIELESESGRGSTFTLVLPVSAPAPGTNAVVTSVPASLARVPRRPVPVEESAVVDPLIPYPTDGVEDDRARLQPGDLVLLIIEDDRAFAQIMVEFAREKKFKAVVAHSGQQGMALAQAIKPAAITLDLRLPDQDGWMVIDWLKHHPQMRHIPIHVISVEEERDRSLRLGAVSYLQKPVTRETLDHALNDTITFLNRPVKDLLVVEDDPAGRQAIIELIGNGDVRTTAVASGAEALAELAKRHFDCLVLDLGLPDMGGAELLKEIHRRFKSQAPPVIVYTGKDLSRNEETELRLNAESIILKSVRSPERLLDETALFLHRVQSKLPEAKRRLIEQGQKTDPILVGRKVLVVDDDVRNIFAITSALESYQMTVIYAESGKAALDTLKNQPDVDVVLMDVMMPEMDGYEAIRQIRQIDRLKKLPIISVTAKAMKGDRERCIDAGASDYIAKPVDMDKLRSLLRVWLYR